MATPRICSIPNCSKLAIKRGWCSAHYQRWQFYGDPLGGGTFNGEPQRYLKDVVLAYQGDECLIWPYARNSAGYAHLLLDGRNQLVARLACEEQHGPPPAPDYDTAHRCNGGQHGCVARSHVRWATRAENMADKNDHGTVNRGTRNGGAKLSEADVRMIRTLLGTTTQTMIAAQFGVSRRTIRSIRDRVKWGWLE